MITFQQRVLDSHLSIAPISLFRAVTVALHRFGAGGEGLIPAFAASTIATTETSKRATSKL